MSDALGLSVGTTNLVAATVGNRPVIRRSVLTLYEHSAPEVGDTAGHADGVVLSGFVERVGDPVPLVGADGSSYPAEQLVVEALESMAALATTAGAADVAIAVPSYWSPDTTAALAETLATSDVLAPAGARLIPDAQAALTALNANPGLDRRGVAVLQRMSGEFGMHLLNRPIIPVSAVASVTTQCIRSRTTGASISQDLRSVGA